MTAPVLAYPDPHTPFILDSDAGDVGAGVELSQEGNWSEYEMASFMTTGH